MKRFTVLIAAGASALLCPVILHAASEVLLEGFETNIDNVVLSGNRGGAGNVVLSQVTKTADVPMGVTQGSKALQVQFLNDQKGWSEDFTLTFNPGATALLKKAWDPDPVTGAKPLARYVLKYDLTFPAAGVVAWMNQAINNHWEAAQEFNTPGNDTSPLTVAIPLDLIPGPLSTNEDGTATFRFIDNADWTDGQTPTLYVDNIRLVDQWANNTPPTTTVIESFEGGITNAVLTVEGGRTTLSQYTSTGAGDTNVTQGSKSLKVVVGQPEGWADDFSLDLSGSQRLKDLLALPASERARYTFRFDAVFQGQPDGGWGGGNWGYKFGVSISTADTARMPSDVATYSVNLASATLDPEAPKITFYGNGGYGDQVVTYFDNFRIVDTGAQGGPGPGATFNILVGYDRNSKQLTITWPAQAGTSYKITSSTDLKTWTGVVADKYPTGGVTGNSASIAVPVKATDRALFFRIEKSS
jgi:hypothetical protein